MKTIDIDAKEWYDRVNGNSYFAGTVTLNYDLKDKETFLMWFQYGYGMQYEQEAKAILTQFNKISPNYRQSLRAYCQENNIILRSNLQRKCNKKELIQIKHYYDENVNTNKKQL
jgi:hypothetical protein